MRRCSWQTSPSSGEAGQIILILGQDDDGIIADRGDGFQHHVAGALHGCVSRKPEPGCGDGEVRQASRANG